MATRSRVTFAVTLTPDASRGGSGSELPFNFPGGGSGESFAAVASDPSYPLSTGGNLGVTFVDFPIPNAPAFVAICNFGLGECIARLNGEQAVASSSSAAAYGTVGGADSCTVGLDAADGFPVTVAFTATDTTAARIAARINAALGAIVATVSASGLLVLTGLRTGGLEAKAKGYSYGAIVVGGDAGTLAKLALVAGASYGAGVDSPFQARLYQEFARSGVRALSRLELSGSGELAIAVAGN